MAGWTPSTLLPSRTGFAPAPAPQGASNMAGPGGSMTGSSPGVGRPEPLPLTYPGADQGNVMRSSMPAPIPNPGSPGSNEQAAQGGLERALQSASNPNNSFGYGR